MPGLEYRSRQIFGSKDYTCTVLMVAIWPDANSNLQGFMVAESQPENDQENLRKKAAEPKAITPVASKTRQTRSCLSLVHPEPDFT